MSTDKCWIRLFFIEESLRLLRGIWKTIASVGRDMDEVEDGETLSNDDNLCDTIQQSMEKLLEKRKNDCQQKINAPALGESSQEALDFVCRLPIINGGASFCSLMQCEPASSVLTPLSKC